MKAWLSAAEIASLNLPGLPASDRGVQLLAARKGWHAHQQLTRPRAGQGGGVEYSIDLLPVDARIAYVARYVGDFDVPGSLTGDLPDSDETLTGRGAEGRDARLALLAAATQFAGHSNLLRARAEQHFCDFYNKGQLDIAPWIRAAVKTITPRTLMRWRAMTRTGDTKRLGVDRGASRRNTGTLERANNGEVKTFCLALIAKQPHLSADHVRNVVLDRFGPMFDLGRRTVPVPPVRTFQASLKGWRERHRVELLALTNPDRFKSEIRIAGRRAHLITRLNEMWQIDASPADVLTVEGRHSVYVCIDVYSRRQIILVTRTPRAAAVGLLLRKAILAWGVPEIVKTDNGSDFVAHATKRLLAALGIECDVARPFTPEEKGVVERSIRTLQHDLMPTLPGYVGHSVADRKQIEARKSFAARLGESPEHAFCVDITPAELQDYADRWANDRYAHRPHSGLNGATPFAVAAAWREPVRRIEDVSALDMLLAPIAGKDGLRTVTKTGIRIGRARYLAPGLDPGTVVLVRMDPADLGRAYVFDESGETFLAHAISPELSGIDPAAAVAAARNEQKARLNQAVAGVKAEMRKLKPRDLADAVLRQAALASGKLAPFPAPAAPHVTPQLAAAASAQSAWEPVHPPEVVEMQARLQAEDARVVPLREKETDWDRFMRARAVEQALARGEHIDPDQLVWLGGYRTGAEYKGFDKVYGADKPAADVARA